MGADTCLRMQPKVISGCVLVVRAVGLLVFLDSVRCALRGALRLWFCRLIGALLLCLRLMTSLQTIFVPYRRVISCVSDFDSLHLLAPSVSGSSVSLRSVSRVSLCCGACVGECGARCGVSVEHVGDCVNSEG